MSSSRNVPIAVIKAHQLKMWSKLFLTVFSVGNIGNESSLLNDMFEKADDKEGLLDFLEHAQSRLKNDVIPEPVDADMKDFVEELNGSLKDGQILILENFIKRNRKSLASERALTSSSERIENGDSMENKAFGFLSLCEGIFLHQYHGDLKEVILFQRSPGKKVRINKEQGLFWSFIGHYSERHWRIRTEALKKLMVNSFEVTETKRKEPTTEVDLKLIGRYIGGTSKREPLKSLLGKMLSEVKEQNRKTAEELFYIIFESALKR